MTAVKEKRRPSALGLTDHLPIEGPGRDDMMQLYSWTHDDAWQAQEEWEKRYGPNIAGRGPFFRWIGATELKTIYEKYRTGNCSAIMEALSICSLNSLPIPQWCEKAFLVSYRKVKFYKAKSWDDVFGRPHPKGMHVEAKRQELEKSYLIYRRIEQIKKEEPHTAIDGALFERVGKEFGVGGKTLTEGYYYRELRLHKPYQCHKCKKRFAHWHDINKDEVCDSCRNKKKTTNKNNQ